MSLAFGLRCYYFSSFQQDDNTGHRLLIYHPPNHTKQFPWLLTKKYQQLKKMILFYYSTTLDIRPLVIHTLNYL